TNGYTIAFDELRSVGVTVPQAAAEEIAHAAKRFAALPDNSVQNPILTFAPHDLVAVATRLRPFLGQLGTSPSATMPDSHNAGHTCDVAGTVTLEVERVAGLAIDGPVLFPLTEDLPYLAQPLSATERERALALGRRYGVEALERSLPICVVGTGPDLNSATD